MINRIFLCAALAVGLTGCPDDDTDTDGTGGAAAGGAAAGGAMAGGAPAGGTPAGGEMGGGGTPAGGEMGGGGTPAGGEMGGGGAPAGGAMGGGGEMAAGPNCPEGGEVPVRLAAACAWLADCAISDCAYEGDVCRAGVYDGCVAFGEPDENGMIPPLAVALGNIVCGHTMCAQTLATATPQNEALAAACMEGAEATTCEEDGEGGASGEGEGDAPG